MCSLYSFSKQLFLNPLTALLQRRTPPRGPQGPPGHRLHAGAYRSCVSPASRTHTQPHLPASRAGTGADTGQPCPDWLRTERPGPGRPAPSGATGLPRPVRFTHLQARCDQVRALAIPPPYPGPPETVTPSLPASPPGPSPPVWTPSGINQN